MPAAFGKLLVDFFTALGCLRISILHNALTAWIMLAASLIVTGAAWKISNDWLIQRAADRFKFQAEDVAQAIRKRMIEYESVLRSGLGLFLASDFVGREEWRTYVAALRIDEYYPGIQGIGFSRIVPKADLQRHVSQVRGEGFPDYSIRPEGERDP